MLKQVFKTRLVYRIRSLDIFLLYILAATLNFSEPFALYIPLLPLYHFEKSMHLTHPTTS
jgi:hypothetical protein